MAPADLASGAQIVEHVRGFVDGPLVIARRGVPQPDERFRYRGRRYVLGAATREEMRRLPWAALSWLRRKPAAVFSGMVPGDRTLVVLRRTGTRGAHPWAWIQREPGSIDSMGTDSGKVFAESS